MTKIGKEYESHQGTIAFSNGESYRWERVKGSRAKGTSYERLIIFRTSQGIQELPEANNYNNYSSTSNPERSDLDQPTIVEVEDLELDIELELDLELDPDTDDQDAQEEDINQQPDSEEPELDSEVLPESYGLNDQSMSDINNSFEMVKQGYDLNWQADKSKNSNAPELSSILNISELPTADLPTDNSTDQDSDPQKLREILGTNKASEQLLKLQALNQVSTEQSVVINGEEVVYDWLKTTSKIFIGDSEKKMGSINIFGSKETRQKIEEKINQLLFYSNSGQELEENFNIIYDHTLSKSPLRSSVYQSGLNKIKETLNLKGEILRKELTCVDYTICLTSIHHKKSQYLDVLLNKLPYQKVSLGLENSKLETAYKEQTVKLLTIPPVSVFKNSMNMDYVEKADYQVIDTEEELIKVCTELNNLPDNHVISYDAETTGLRFHKFISEDKKAQLVTHSLSWRDNQSIIIPIRMKYCQNLPPEMVAEYLGPILERKRILAHNGAFDVRANMHEDPALNIELNLQEDTFILIKHILSYLGSDETGEQKTRSKVRRSLEYLVKRALGKDMINLKQQVFRPQNANFDFSVLPYDYLIWYGCPDTDLCRQLWKILRTKLESSQIEGYIKQVVVSKIYAELSTYPGVALSKEVFLEERETTIREITRIKQLFYAMAQENEQTLSMTAPKQMANFVYNKLNVPITEEIKRTKDGFATDKNTLGKIASQTATIPHNIFKQDLTDEQGNVHKIGKKTYLTKEYLNTRKYPVLSVFLLYKQIQKDLGSFDTFIKKSIDGIYHPEPKVGSTATYRTTEGVQTIKGSLKRGLQVYGPEYYFCSMDVRSEELILAMNMSEDDDIINTVKEPEVDIHAMAGSELEGIPIYLVSSDLRKKAKAVNFGVIFNMGVYTLAQNMTQKLVPSEKDVEEIRPIFDKYRVRFADMLSKIRKFITPSLRTGVISNVRGLRMIYDIVIDIEDLEEQVFDKNQLHPPTIRLDQQRFEMYGNKLFTKMGNFPIQSWASDVFYDAMISFYYRLKKHNLIGKVFMPMQVHDEKDLIIHQSVPPPLIMKLLKESWETDFAYLNKNYCTLYIGIGFGNNWGEGKADENEIPVRLQNIIVEEYDKDPDSFPDLPGNEVKNYYEDRIKKYMISRLYDTLQYEFSTGDYKTGKVVDKLVIDTFVMKKSHELFKILANSDDFSSIQHQRIIELVTQDPRYIQQPTPLTITETRPTVFDKQEEEFTEVSFDMGYVYHKNVYLDRSKIVIDVRSIKDKYIMDNLIDYLQMFKSTKTKSVAVYLKTTTNPEEPIPDLRISGLPANVRDHLDLIYTGSRVEQLIQPPPPPPPDYGISDVLYKVNGDIYINLSCVPPDDHQYTKNTILQEMLPILDLEKRSGEQDLILVLPNPDPSGTEEFIYKREKNIVAGPLDFKLQKSIKQALGI